MKRNERSTPKSGTRTTPVRAMLDVMGGQRQREQLVDRIDPKRFGKGEGRFLRKLVLLAIATSANPDGTNAYPSMKTIAHRCLLRDERHARKIVAWLRKHKLIKVKENAHEIRPGSGLFTNDYTILFDEQRTSKEKRKAQTSDHNYSDDVLVPGSTENNSPASARRAPVSHTAGTVMRGAGAHTPEPNGSAPRDETEADPRTKIVAPRDRDPSNRPLNRPENRPSNAQQQQKSAEQSVVAARGGSPFSVSSSSNPRLSKKERDTLNGLKGSVLHWWNHPRLVKCPMPCNPSLPQLADFLGLFDREGGHDVYYAWIWWQVRMAEEGWSQLSLGENYAEGTERWRHWPMREFLNVADRYVKDVRQYSHYFRDGNGFYPVAVCFLLLSITEGASQIDVEQISRLKRLDKKCKLDWLRDACESRPGGESVYLDDFLDQAEELLDFPAEADPDERSVAPGEECTPEQQTGNVSSAVVPLDNQSATENSEASPPSLQAEEGQLCPCQGCREARGECISEWCDPDEL